MPAPRENHEWQMPLSCPEEQVGKLSSLTKFIADAFFLPAKIVKTTKVSRTATEEK
jgi:hypothetical protein